MPPREAWAAACFTQDAEEWTVFLQLHARRDMPVCRALHYLQMATEKLAKAYRFRDTDTATEVLRSSHVGFRAFLKDYLNSPRIRDAYKGRDAQLRRIRRDAEKLARAVEQLAPAVDRIGRPGNTEYPWEDGINILIPAYFNFPDLSLLTAPPGRVFLNLLNRAFRDYSPGGLP